MLKLEVSCKKINANETEVDPNFENYFKDFLKTF